MCVTNTESFNPKASVIHGNRYDYTQVVYLRNNQPIAIICPTRGISHQWANDHLSGCGCKHCGGNTRWTAKEFICKACVIHGNRYDYTQVVYINTETQVTIVCPQHGSFAQGPTVHFRGSGCKECNYVPAVPYVTTNELCGVLQCSAAEGAAEHKPYVYRLDQPTTGEFYYGYSAGGRALGVNYFTGSKYVISRFVEFIVIDQFFFGTPEKCIRYRAATDL